MRVLRPQLLVMVFVSRDQALLVQLFTIRGYAPVTQHCSHGLAHCSNYELPIYHIVSKSKKSMFVVQRQGDGMATMFVLPRSTCMSGVIYRYNII